MINVSLKQIDKAIIESLISNEVRESRTLDYKEKLPGGKNEDKKEFLADVSAMANAAGGDIVYGIAEKREEGRPTGIAETISVLGGVNLDAESLRLESIIRDGLDPRINGIQFWAVDGFRKWPCPDPTDTEKLPSSPHDQERRLPLLLKARLRQVFARCDADSLGLRPLGFPTGEDPTLSRRADWANRRR